MINVGGDKIGKILVGADEIKKIFVGQKLIYQSGPTDTIEQLRADMEATDYCRLSFTVGDQQYSKNRYWNRGSSEPLIMLPAGGPSYAGYACLSRTSTRPVHSTSGYGDVESYGTYTTPSGSLVYVWLMKGLWPDNPLAVKFTAAGSSVLEMSIARPYVHPYIGSPCDLYSGTDTAEFEQMVEFVDRFYRLTQS